MALRIDGKAVAAKVKAKAAGEAAALKEKGIVPGLAVVIVGSDPEYTRRSTLCRRRPPRRSCWPL